MSYWRFLPSHMLSSWLVTGQLVQHADCSLHRNNLTFSKVQPKHVCRPLVSGCSIVLLTWKLMGSGQTNKLIFSYQVGLSWRKHLHICRMDFNYYLKIEAYTVLGQHASLHQRDRPNTYWCLFLDFTRPALLGLLSLNVLMLKNSTVIYVYF